MTNEQKKLIQSTIPILKENGIDLTKHFYQRLFDHNPELKNIFNMNNQVTGKQQTALANAVLAYAEHIENPGVLINVLKSIGNKHVSLNVTPEQYNIVGRHLISSIKKILGETATDDLLEAWTQAYNELAQIMISIEKELYTNNMKRKGGWKGWRKFIITNIVKESIEVKSFYLKPADKNPIADYFSGQFISVKIFIPELGHQQPRQYSLSAHYNDKYYRISVKKDNTFSQNNSVSNALHEKKVGDEILVSSPSGVFYDNFMNSHPRILISGGIGATPLLSMVEANKNNLKKNIMIWLHGCRNEKVHAFKDYVNFLTENSTWLTTHIFYENDIEHDMPFTKKGRINLFDLKDEILIDNAEYYICGPETFIKIQYNSLIQLGVLKDKIHYEEFGPQLLQLN